VGVWGAAVSWSYKPEYEGSPLTVHFKGKIESPSRIAGSLSVDEHGMDGEITATQGS